jgi:tetratricopeptide (TPR) repeat protein
MLALAFSCGAAALARASDQSPPAAVRNVAVPHDTRREEAELLTKRGLVLLHAERYAEALPVFTQAAATNPDDVYVLYYKGVTEGRLGQWPAAVADLRAVMAKQPDLLQGALELGVALLHDGQPAEAAVWLARAQQVPELDASASFYLGIAQLRSGELAAARQSLERAAAGDPQYTVACRYYQGVVEVRLGNPDRAIELFQYVAATSPETAVGREANDFLVAVQRGVQPTLRRYQLYGGTGLEYDSNVVLAPLDGEVAVGFGQQADGRAIFLTGGRYQVWRAEHWQVGAGYDFFQSLHFNLTQFNMQDHRPSLAVTGATGRFEGGVLGAYDYYLRDGNSFLQQAEALPWGRVNEPGFGRTEVFFRMQRRDFKVASLQRVLDSFTYLASVDQFVDLGTPDRYVVAGYRFDTMVPTDGAVEVFAYDGNQVRAGVGGILPLEIAAELDFTYRNKNYAPASHGRDDNEYRIIATADKQVAKYTYVTLAYFGTFNDSDQAVFSYNRQIVSLSVQVRY